MAIENKLVTFTRVAGADLSTKMYRFVKQDNTGKVTAQTVADADCFGVLQNAPLSGGEAEIAYAGVTRMVAGGTVAIGDKVSSDSAGRAVTAGSGVVLGECVQGGAVNNIISVLLGKYAATGSVYSFSSNASDVQTATVTLTTAQVKALNATPIELVPAPGAGYANVFVGAEAFLDYATTAYAGIAAGEDVSIKYTNGSGLAVATFEATGFLDATADSLRWVPPAAATTNAAQTIVANAALVAHMETGEIITGDSPLKIRTYYRVIPATL